jgi:hypothetical protein
MHQIFQQSILFKYGFCLLFFWSGDMNISTSCRQAQSRLYTVEIHTWPQTLSCGSAYSGLVIFLAFIYLLYFLSSLFVSILQSYISLLLQVTVPFLFEFRSISSCVCPFFSCHILTSAVSYARNKLFQVLALFCIVTNYWRWMWSIANCRGNIGGN